MITAIVRFKLPASIDAARAAELFQGSAPKYQGLSGLIRKYYLFDAENRTGAGCYLWRVARPPSASITPNGGR